VEGKENEVLTAKADQTSDEAPSKPTKKGKRALWIVLAVLGACLLFGLGAVAGGGAVFGLTRARSRVHVQPRVFMWGPHRELIPELPMRPGRMVVLSQTGALIAEVVPDSPAEQAGIREGDILVSVDGKALDEDSDLAVIIGKHKPGDKITVEITEFGVRTDTDGREITVTLAGHPEEEGKAYLGVTFVPMPTDGVGPEWRSFRFEHYDDDDDDEHFWEQFEFHWPRR
jgi:membrane-associated protease RseP (regulator of RpoE activity)